MRLSEFLIESATDIVYHYMSANDAVRTLTDGHYSLESSTGMPAEETWLPKGKKLKPWYLATTRSKVGDYTIRHANTSGVVFELNGRWLNSRYETLPIDYWEGMYRSSAFNIGPDARTSESEDRVFSTENTIPLKGSTIAIHAFINPIEKLASYEDPERWGYRSAEVRAVIKLGQQIGIPVYLYDNKNKWLTQRPQYRIDINSPYASELLAGTEHTKSYTYSESDYYKNMKYWIELLTKNPGNELSPQAEKLIYDLRYYSDNTSSLANDMHNAARNPTDPNYKYIVIINRFMVQNKLKKLKQFVDYIKDKWKRDASK